jgi:large subunit ribosomal protein L35
MPKVKSNRAAMKRFKVTGAGKIKRMKAGKSHILTKKNRKRKRDLRKATYVAKTDEKHVKKMILA